MTINIGTDFTAVPTVTRTSEPNPFADLATILADNRDKAIPVTVDLTAGTSAEAEEARAKELAKVKRHLSLAGDAANVTLRSTVVGGGSAKQPQAVFTVWAVDKIVRKPKAQGDTPSAE